VRRRRGYDKIGQAALSKATRPIKKFPKTRQRDETRLVLPLKKIKQNEKKTTFTQTFVNRLMNEVTRETKTSKAKQFDTQLSPKFAMQMPNSCGQNNGTQGNSENRWIANFAIFALPYRNFSN